MRPPTTDLAAEVERAEGAVRRAPEPLDLVQSLVNTLNRVRGYDLLADGDLARWWLARVAPDLDAGRLRDKDLAGLVSLREGLRGLLRSATGGEAVDAESVAVIRAVGRSHPLAVSVDGSGVPQVGPVTEPRDQPADVLAGRVLAALPAAAGLGTLPRLKACANPDCEWAFYDTSRSRSGSWCVMNLCGARHKMSRYRDRQRASVAEPAEGSRS